MTLPKVEQQALELLANGYTTQQIAAAMHVSHSTVRRWLVNTYIRLGATNGYMAVKLALQKGLIA